MQRKDLGLFCSYCPIDYYCETLYDLLMNLHSSYTYVSMYLFDEI